MCNGNAFCGNSEKTSDGKRTFSAGSGGASIRDPLHGDPMGERQPSAGRRDDLPPFQMSRRGCQHAALRCPARRNAQRHHSGRPENHTGRQPACARTGDAEPNATVVGFTKPSEALEYARDNRVALAFLDIELGNTNGLDLCRALLDINPRTNVVYLTAYSGYSLEAWNTGASGFMLKPITPEGVQAQLKNLRYPFYNVNS